MQNLVFFVSLSCSHQNRGGRLTAAVAAGRQEPDEEQYLSDDSVDPDEMTYEVLPCCSCVPTPAAQLTL